MKRSLYIIGGVAWAAALPSILQAQTVQPKDTTVNRTIVVEQTYNPDIMDASKVNVLPRVEEPTVSKKAVEYATSLFPARSIPAGLMPSYTGREVQPATFPGYVRLGYGTYGNLDVLGNYLFRPSDRDKLNLRFEMDGMDGKLTLPGEGAGKWNAFFYRSRANVDYTHQFRQADFHLAGEFGLSNFNLLPGSFSRKQKFTSGSFHIGVQHTDADTPLRFRAETNLSMYSRRHNYLAASAADTELKEMLVRTKGAVTGDIGDSQSVTLGLEMNNFLYSGNGATDASGGKLLKNYTALLLNPYYEWNGEDWKLRLGAHVDLSFGFDKLFRISPDVLAQYTFSESYVLYARATGGKRFNEFRRLEQLSPYAKLPDAADGIIRPFDTYEMLNAGAGFKASPYPGVWFHLYGGYQSLLNDLSYINTATAAVPSELTFAQGGTSNFYAGGEISYAYKDIVELSARYTYRDYWSDKSEQSYLLAVKPVGEASFNLRVHPMTALDIHAGYDFIDRKHVDTHPRMTVVHDLHAGASYNLFKGLSVYVRAHNLLNKKYQYDPGYPTEGLNVLGGVSFRF